MVDKTEYSANALTFTGAFSRQTLISAWSAAQECIIGTTPVKPNIKLNLVRLWRPDESKPAAYLSSNDKGTVSVVPVMLSYRSVSENDIAVIAYAAEDAEMEAPFTMVYGTHYRESEIKLVQGSQLEIIFNLGSSSGYIDRFTTPDGDTLEFACPDGEKAEISAPPCPRSCLRVVDEELILMLDRQALEPSDDGSGGPDPDPNKPDDPFHL